MDRCDNYICHWFGVVHIVCDPLSGNAAFYENQDKTRNWYINVQLCGSEKMSVAKLQSEAHSGYGMQVLIKHNVFALLR